MQTLEDWIKNLKHSKKLIIVEGIKDKKALEDLGVKHIVTLSKKPLYSIIEDIAEKHKDCIILVDLDKEGRKLFGKLNSGLTERGVRIDNKFREFLFKETKLRQIEGIIKYLEKQLNKTIKS